MSWQKIHSLCLDRSEKFCFAADNSGQIHVLETLNLNCHQIIRGHSGEINCLAIHPQLPLLASLGEDRRVCLWTYTPDGRITKTFDYSIRNVFPENSSKLRISVHSTSQALAFHAEKPWLISRTAASAIMEMDVSGATPRLIRCFAADENWDIATVRYEGNSDDVLVGTVRGRALLMREGRILREWKIEDETIHWFERSPDGTYFLASDSRSVVHIDPTKNEILNLGPKFARDDFEHITRCRSSGRFYAASFDRNIYEIDPVSLRPLKVVYKAPFKTRWIRTLTESPSHLILQCRNGGVYKINLETQELLSLYKKTPDSLWSACSMPDGELLFAGEGSKLLRARLESGDDIYQTRTQLKTHQQELTELGPSYTKRIVSHPTKNQAAMGRTDGHLYVIEDSQIIQRRCFPSAIRDLGYHSDGSMLFAATEDGVLYKLDALTLAILDRFESSEPLWSLAVSPDGKWIATAERKGNLHIISCSNLKEFKSYPCSRLPKRMKWFDNDRLWFTNSTDIFEFKISDDLIKPAFQKMRNTVEDFIWTSDRRYLIAASYNRMLFLFDTESKEMLWVTADQMDYTKGLIALPPTRYPYEFLSIGRTGVPMLFQIYEEKILSLGRA